MVRAVGALDLSHLDRDLVRLHDQLALLRHNLLVQIVFEEPQVLAIEAVHLEVERARFEVAGDILLGEVTHTVEPACDIHIHIVRLLAVAILVPPERRDRRVSQAAGSHVARGS